MRTSVKIGAYCSMSSIKSTYILRLIYSRRGQVTAATTATESKKRT